MMQPEGTREDPGVESAANGLLAAAETLDRAVDQEDDALAAALEGRARAFAELRETARGPLPPRARAILERVVELDRALVVRAQGKLAAVRTELGQVRRARGALQVLEGETPPPRFVSERA